MARITNVSVIPFHAPFSHPFWKFLPNVTSGQVTMSGQVIPPPKIFVFECTFSNTLYAFSNVLIESNGRFFRVFLSLLVFELDVAILPPPYTLPCGGITM